MAISRPWRIVAGAGAAAVIAGLGGVAYASDRINLTDRQDPPPVETVELVSEDDALDSFESAGDSPFDSALSADSSASPVSPASPASAASVDSPISPDSPASPVSPASADSADSVD